MNKSFLEGNDVQKKLKICSRIVDHALTIQALPYVSGCCCYYWSRSCLIGRYYYLLFVILVYAILLTEILLLERCYSILFESGLQSVLLYFTLCDHVTSG